jgi:hypothetical protein
VLDAPITAAVLAFSPDGAVLAGGDGITGLHGGIYLWPAGD